MENHLLEQLGEVEVPPLPKDFDRQVHSRLNSRLLVAHLADLALRGLPTAVMHFAWAWVGLVRFSLTGRFETARRGGADSAAGRSREFL